MTGVPTSVAQHWEFEGGPWDGVLLAVTSTTYGPEVLLVAAAGSSEVHYWRDSVPERGQEPRHYLYRTRERIRTDRG